MDTGLQQCEALRHYYTVAAQPQKKTIRFVNSITTLVVQSLENTLYGMRPSFKFLVSSILFGICSGCIYPGMSDLEANGITKDFSVHGKNTAIARCVSKITSEEQFSWHGMIAPVTGYNEYSDTSSIELTSTLTNCSSCYNWFARLQQIDANTVSVKIVGRTNTHPALSQNYMVDKVFAAIDRCAVRE